MEGEGGKGVAFGGWGRVWQRGGSALFLGMVTNDPTTSNDKIKISISSEKNEKKCLFHTHVAKTL